MTIERSLGRLTPKQDRQDTNKAVPSGGVAAPAVLSVSGSGDANDQRIEQRIMRSAGNASLDTGNDYGGMPQVLPELRAVGETAIKLAATGGNIALDLSLANVFVLELTGAATITFDTSRWPKTAYQRTQGLGIDLSCSVIIQKGATAFNIVCNHWAPDDLAPDLSSAGFYEIGFAVLEIGGTKIVRGFPAIKPE